MAKKDHSDALWAEDMKKGWKPCLVSRLKFHKALCERVTADNTQRGVHTVRNWFRKLVEEGLAKYGDDGTYIILNRE